MKHRGWILPAILSLVILFGASAQAQAPKEFKIGAILAMTGSGSWYGQVMSQGFRYGRNISIQEGVTETDTPS